MPAVTKNTRRRDHAEESLIPPPLIQQLKSGGKPVIPVGLPDAQTLIVVDKPKRDNDQRNSAGTVFTA